MQTLTRPTCKVESCDHYTRADKHFCIKHWYLIPKQAKRELFKAQADPDPQVHEDAVRMAAGLVSELEAVG